MKLSVHEAVMYEKIRIAAIPSLLHEIRTHPWSIYAAWKQTWLRKCTKPESEAADE